MPWTPKDAPSHNKATEGHSDLQRQWAEVANNVLKQTGDEGRAVREANGVIRRHEGEIKK